MSSSSSSSYYSNPNSALVPTECKCHLPLRQLTAWTKENPAKRFLICPNRYKTRVKKWVWLDLKLENEWYRSHLYEMHRLRCIRRLNQSKERTIGRIKYARR
ncbi:hypothetical protein Tco_0608448 [Tanacetum coccineum]